MALTPFVVTVSLLGYALVRLIVPKRGKPPHINKEVKKDNPKVVDLVEIEDMEKDKMSYCRCWKSKKVSYHCVYLPLNCQQLGT